MFSDQNYKLHKSKKSQRIHLFSHLVFSYWIILTLQYPRVASNCFTTIFKPTFTFPQQLTFYVGYILAEIYLLTCTFRKLLHRVELKREQSVFKSCWFGGDLNKFGSERKSPAKWAAFKILIQEQINWRRCSNMPKCALKCLFSDFKSLKDTLTQIFSSVGRQSNPRHSQGSDSHWEKILADRCQVPPLLWRHFLATFQVWWHLHLKRRDSFFCVCVCTSVWKVGGHGGV